MTDHQVWAEDQGEGDTQRGIVLGPPFGRDQARHGTQPFVVSPNTIAGDQTTDATQDWRVPGTSFGRDQSVCDTQDLGVSPELFAADHQTTNGTMSTTNSFDDPLLLVLADAVDDLENTRKTLANRHRSLIQIKDQGGTVETDRMRRMVEVVHQLEKGVIRDLRKAVAQHPLGPWVAAHDGIGEKTIGRLLGVIGDPYWPDQLGRPRTVSELWSYCGLGVNDGMPLQRATDGRWNRKARSLLIGAIAEVAFRQGDYRPVYEEAKEKALKTVHIKPCSGHWALIPGTGTQRKLYCTSVRKDGVQSGRDPGEPLSDGHAHARALRIVAKTILKDLWIESKRLHSLERDHKDPDTQDEPVLLQ